MRFRRRTYTDEMPAERPVSVRDERSEVVRETRPDARERIVTRDDAVVPVAATAYEERVTRNTAPRVYEESVSDRHYGYFDSLPARVNSALFAVLFAIEALLSTRFLLVAFGASTRSGFVDFIMDVSWPFVRPFSNAFTNRTWDQGIVEINTLLAAGVWFIIFMLVSLLVTAVLPRFDDHTNTTQRRRVTHV